MVPAHAQVDGPSRAKELSAGVETSVSFVETSHSPASDGSDLVLQLRPSVSLNIRSGRVRGSGTYALGLARHSGRDSDSSDVQNSLNAAFTAEALENWLFVDAAASVSQASFSARGQQTADGSLQTNKNRTEVATVSLAPRVRGQLGEFATYSVGANARATNTRRSIDGDSTGTGVTAAVDSRNEGSVFGWGLLGSSDRTSFRRGRSTEEGRVQLKLRCV